MKQKHVDAAREARLWIYYVILPSICIYAGSPTLQHKAKQIKYSAKCKVNNVVNKIKNR